MASHAIFQFEKINREGVLLETLQHTADLDNGSVVHAGDLISGSAEIKSVVVPTTASITGTELLLVHSPEIQGNMYEPYTTLQDFYNPANKPFRAYHPQVGHIFSISSDGITGTAAVDSYLIPQNGSTQLAVAADLTGGTRFAAKIISTTESFGYTGSGYAKKTKIVAQVVKC